MSDEIEMLESLLAKEKLSELKIMAKDLWIHLTDAMQKQDIIERLMCMAHIRAIQEDNSAYSDDGHTISYLTDETKQDIWGFPSFFQCFYLDEEPCWLAGGVHLHEYVDIFLWKGQSIWHTVHESLKIS